MRPVGDLGRRESIADRAQVVELELVRGELLEQPGDHVLVDPRLGSQPRHESAQVQLPAVKRAGLGPQLGKLIARLFRLVAKPRNLDLLLACLGTQPGQFPVDSGRIFRHRYRLRDPQRSR